MKYKNYKDRTIINLPNITKLTRMENEVHKMLGHLYLYSINSSSIFLKMEYTELHVFGKQLTQDIINAVNEIEYDSINQRYKISIGVSKVVSDYNKFQKEFLSYQSRVAPNN